jgi:hypothetical protein
MKTAIMHGNLYEVINNRSRAIKIKQKSKEKITMKPRKILTILLTAIFILTLTACGGGNDDFTPEPRNDRERDRNPDVNTPENDNPAGTNQPTESDNNNPIDPYIPEEPVALTVDWERAVNPPLGLEASPVNEFDYKYDANLSGIIIEKYNGSAGHVMIPDSIEGEPVVALSSTAFANNRTLEYIYFPDSLIQIDANTFDKCVNLTLVIPDRIEIIVTGNIRGISTQVKNLELSDRMFGMNNRNRLPFFQDILSNNIENIMYDGVNYNLSANREAVVSELYELIIGGCFTSDVEISALWTYQYVDYRDHFDGGYGIYGIAVTDFDHRNNSNIKIEIPAMIEGTPVVSVGIFRAASNQTVFNSASDIIEITFPESVKAIGRFAFYQMESLRTINLPNDLIVIDISAFRQTGLTEISLPNSLLEIRERAFAGCSNLVVLSIPENLNKIGFIFESGEDKLSRHGITSNPTVMVYKGQTYTHDNFTELSELINE